VTHLLHRFTRHTDDAAATRNIERALRESVVIAIEPGSPAGKKALRGVPVVGGCSGTMFDTDPLQALLDTICDCGRTKDRDYSTCRTCAIDSKP
jgi:hypothetical protein